MKRAPDRLLAVALTIMLAGCSWTFGRGHRRCDHPVALTAVDFTLGAGAAGTGLAAGYPCVVDVDGQSDRVRALHCGIAVAGVALGSVFIASALTGLRRARSCD